MRRILLIISLFLCLILSLTLSFPTFAATYESVSLLNSTNLAQYFGDHLGFLYDSHGCLHFTPPDIYLLVRTIPKGIPLIIKSYSEKTLPAGFAAAPVFNQVVSSESDVRRFAQIFRDYPAQLVVYPSLGKLFILLNDQPYLQVQTLAGPPQDYRQAFSLLKNGPIVWDPFVTSPTDAGNYIVLRTISHYISNNYYWTTIVPFGGWMQKHNGKWIYQDEKKWFQLPAFIAADLALPYGQGKFNYYDVNLDAKGAISAARWGSNDFGKHALLWTSDGRNPYPELGYAEGELVFEQVTLVKDLAYLLTVPGPDQLDDCIGKNDNLVLYRDSYNFVVSSGEVIGKTLDPSACSYYKLFNGIKLNSKDKKNIDQRLIKAYNTVKGGIFPGLLANKDQRERALGLYYFLRDYDATFRKQAGWYQMLKDEWNLWSNLRQLLRKDFNNSGINSLSDRQLTAEQWLSDRLEFRQIAFSSPKGRK